MNLHKIKVEFSYWEDSIPKYCRKVRPVRFDKGVVTLSIPMVSSKEAPIAILKSPCFEQDEPISYHWWNQQLWKKDDSQYFGDGILPYEMDIRSQYRPQARELGYCSALVCPSKEQVIKGLKTCAADWLFIDGALYRVSGEPRYVTMTFGLGSNHGGTSLMWSSHYNSNIGAKSYFSLLQKEEAIARATQIAINRGDTKSLPIEADDFEVLIPQAIRLNPAKEHGDGCEFLNSLEAVAQASGGNQAVVAATAISLALANK